MILLPAIDLYEGKAVRLYKGDYAQMTVYSEDPLAVARDFAACGAEWIHMVDLEGARDGGTPNLKTVERVAKETALRVELGGVFGERLFFVLLRRLVELRFLRQRPDLFLEGRCLLAVLVGESAVFVEHFFQLRQLVEGARLRHRRGQITDKAGRGAPLRDDALAGNRH